MKVLGLDLGNRTIGIAISDKLGFLARPVETYRFDDRDFPAAKNYIVQFVEESHITEIVLGYPKNMDGSVGEQGQISERFKKLLEDELDIPIILWDERLTSKMASSMMKEQKLQRKKRKQTIDTMAATIILQGYLDRRK
ncbi:Holliday junction resolvase RuvX [Candidatus Xianfuyuplasma coldseepsis]|uniref:Putative pre-16S rRNA nuclease n=1 Tax=Candidatus Xianfuyuplasma coldseepsis TaxID=2782163 RepID=A0A7L7KS99_9MOLU|nr:Holliday junction resolvase RuvX [Xianfuyuplasma coldseepsis]QMS85613.1 Holliday junction resolvase RuvX [Xianfuyuplasma coldseepsis]